MSIRIVNLRTYRPIQNEILIKVDRSSVIGNPFYMKDESKRDEVCDKYQTYFDGIISIYLNSASKLTDKETLFINEIARIGNLACKQDIALGCWCAPKRCHAETIKRFIEANIKEE